MSCQDEAALHAAMQPHVGSKCTTAAAFGGAIESEHADQWLRATVLTQGVQMASLSGSSAKGGYGTSRAPGVCVSKCLCMIGYDREDKPYWCCSFREHWQLQSWTRCRCIVRYSARVYLIAATTRWQDKIPSLDGKISQREVPSSVVVRSVLDAPGSGKLLVCS
jgi:hypothetical protein